MCVEWRRRLLSAACTRHIVRHIERQSVAAMPDSRSLNWLNACVIVLVRIACVLVEAFVVAAVVATARKQKNSFKQILF